MDILFREFTYLIRHMMKTENGLSLKMKLLVLFAGIMFVMRIATWGVIVYLVTSLGPHFFFKLSLRVKDSSVERSTDGEIVDFIFSKDASRSIYDTMLVEDKNKVIPERVRHLISEEFYLPAHGNTQ